MKHEKHPFQAEVEDMLEKFGGFYNFQDILDGIAVGRFQSFCLGESWAVTQICEFPRKTVLDIMFVVGHLGELELLSADLESWCRERAIPYAMANGRLGFMKKAFPGWKMVSATFVKDLR